MKMAQTFKNVKSVFFVMCSSLRTNRDTVEPAFQQVADSFEVAGDGAPRPITTDDRGTMMILAVVIGVLLLTIAGEVAFSVMNAKKKARTRAERKARLERARGG